MLPCLLQFLRTSRLSRTLLGAAGAATLLLAPLPAAQLHNHTTVFAGGTGSHYYRIPALIATSNGTLIAVAEDRVESASDWGNINLVCKRSTNDGATWSAATEIVGAGLGSWTNPTLVYDPPGPDLLSIASRANGRVWLFFNWNNETARSMDDIGVGDRPTYVCYSDDHGANWSARVNISASVTPPTYAWDAIGPGTGIRMTQAHVGRLVVPATRRNIYSDNHGQSWTYQTIPGGTGESSVVECLGGDLLRNDRPTASVWEAGAKRRQVSRGTIEGGFPAFTSDNALLDPKCQASILRYNWAEPDRVIFLNSASTVDDPMQEGRSKMTVRMSYDDGATWKFSRWLYDWLTVSQAIAQGKGGYSSMTKTTHASYPLGVGILVETNNGTVRSIDFHKVNLEWIRNGAAD
ncbi:MAG: exo-alpha-sialidase [Opitutae bacterium]|nr:exo-alpha-sialidase [Opitutae bacterium]